MSLELDPTKPGIYKFVRVNGAYRFCSVMNQHSDLVATGEEAESAGIVMIFDTSWRFGDFNYSSTLRVGTDENDEPALTKIIGKPNVERL